MSKFKPGQSLTEYALPIALIGIMGILSLSVLGNNLSDMFTNTFTTKKSWQSFL
ncbi:MAG: Flp family type IVb pilin [Cyanobacteria bacterium]|nr:Flp family type IVb pilin [Cyanobacteriota bacterium]